jgi:glucose-1-phosphate cytidylyltransferase
MEVVILAGGTGARASPLSMAMPKPLIPIKGIPIIRMVVDFFKANNYRKFIICIGYKGDSIKRYFDSFNHGLDIAYVNSGLKADILKRIVDCEHLVSDRFFVCYGDAIANLNLPNLLDFHISHKAWITLTTFQMRSPFGLVVFNDSGRVEAFNEKPILSHWMNIGFMVFEKKVLKQARNILLEKKTWLDFLNHLISMKKLYSFKHTGLHYTFNTELERQEMENDFDRFYKIIERGVLHEG